MSTTNLSDPMIINEKIGSFVIELVDLNSVKTFSGEMEKKDGEMGKKTV